MAEILYLICSELFTWELSFTSIQKKITKLKRKKKQWSFFFFFLNCSLSLLSLPCTIFELPSYWFFYNLKLLFKIFFKKNVYNKVFLVEHKFIFIEWKYSEISYKYVLLNVNLFWKKKNIFWYQQIYFDWVKVYFNAI